MLCIQSFDLVLTNVCSSSMRPKSPSRNLPIRSPVHLGYSKLGLKFLPPKSQELVGFPR